MAHLGAAADGPADSRASRIGVFVCHCGGNISDVVDVERVAAEAARMPGVVLATAYPFVCSDPGQALIEEKIRELELDRVVVAACSPTLHQTTFRRTIDRAGLNQYLFEHVNVREQVSWVVEDHEAATRKASRLVRAAVGPGRAPRSPRQAAHPDPALGPRHRRGRGGARGRAGPRAARDEGDARREPPVPRRADGPAPHALPDRRERAGPPRRAHPGDGARTADPGADRRPRRSARRAWWGTSGPACASSRAASTST